MVNFREKASLSKTNIFHEVVLFFVEIPLSLRQKALHEEKHIATRWITLAENNSHNLAIHMHIKPNNFSYVFGLYIVLQRLNIVLTYVVQFDY